MDQLFFYGSLSVALSIDTFLVSLAISTGGKKGVSLSVIDLLIFATTQVLFCFFGIIVGRELASVLHGFFKFFSFLIFLYLGTKILIESRVKKRGVIGDLTFYKVVIFSISTSIDALGVGLALGGTAVRLVPLTIILAVVTFLFGFLGTTLGNQLKEFGKFSSYMASIIFYLLAISMI